MPRRLGRILIALITLLAFPDLNVQAAGGGYLYALRNVDGAPNQIYAFQVNELTGILTALPGFPVATGGNGYLGGTSEQLAYDPVHRRLYAINYGSGTVSAYSVNLETGALAALPFSPIPLGAGSWTCLAVHPGGSPLVVGDSSGNRLASLNITGETASAAPGSPFSVGQATPLFCEFNRNGDYVYAGGGGGTRIAGYSVNPGTGVLTALLGSPFDSGGSSPWAYATDDQGRLFVANAASSRQVRAFYPLSGVPYPASGNPFPSGVNTPIHGLWHPAGYYLVANHYITGNTVGVYRIGGSGPGTTLTAVNSSPFPSGGSGINVLAHNQSGALLFAAHNISRNITTFSVNGRTGALTGLFTQVADTLGASGTVSGLVYAGQPTPSSPPGAGFLFTLENRSGTENLIYGFGVNELNGSLALLPGFPVGTGSSGVGRTVSEQLAYDPGHNQLYALNGETISVYRVNRITGNLTALPFSPISLPPGLWNCLAVHPGGSPLVAGDSLANRLASYNIADSGAVAASGSPFATGPGDPFSCAFSRDGLYVYAGGQEGNAIAGFSVNADTGILAPLPGSPFPSGALYPLAYAADSSGRLFVTNIIANQVRAFTTSGGVISAVSNNPFTSGLTQAVHALLHPAGYYLVADRSGNQVGAYRIAGGGSATTLTAVSGSPFSSGGLFTSTLALNSKGTFLFAAHGVSRNISSYAVNGTTGALQGVSIQPRDTAGSSDIITGMVYVPGLSYFFLPLVER